jgi:threonine dehydratase
MHPVSLADVRAAAQRIAGAVEHTPCVHSRTLSRLTGAQVFLKFENLQFTASFKERGALVKLLSLASAERARGVIAMSAGNHAQAVAYHARRLGIPATIVMPRTTPNVKVENTAAFGAQVVLHGKDLEEARRRAEELRTERELAFVHPYDDPQIIRGQGTVAIEMLEVAGELDALLVPIGGGGLIAGCAIAAKALHPRMELIGVQCARYPTMRQALEGAPITAGGKTIAEGIAVKDPGKHTLPIVRELVDDVLLVDEHAIEEAVRLLLEIEKTVVEGAGAAGLAALMSQGGRFTGRRVGTILTGGNIDPLVLSSIIHRGLVRSGRLARLAVELDDSPGALSDVTRCLAEADANIVEVLHQRAFTHAPLKSAEVQFVLQTRGLSHMHEVLAALARAGYAAHWLEHDEHKS